MKETRLNKSYVGSIYPNLGNGRNKLFTQVWSNADAFVEDYKNVGIPATIKDDSARTLFYLLYANYGNTPIAPSDVTRFKYKLFSIVFQYAPTWEKRLEIQEKVRNLTDEELQTGSVQIYNRAENPGTDPTTQSNEELTYINSQNVTKNRRGILDSYGFAWELLNTDVTKVFLDKFRKLFIKIAEFSVRATYAEEEEENEC